MRLRGEFTVEAAFISSFVFLIIAAFINLDLTVHDAVINDVTKVMGGIEYRESKYFFRNADNGKIETEAVIEKPLTGKNDLYADQQKIIISRNAEDYYASHKISSLSQGSDTDIGNVLTAGDNAMIVRAGGKAVQIIGGQK